MMCILALMYMSFLVDYQYNTCVLFDLSLFCRSIIGQDFAGFKDNLLALVYAMPFVSKYCRFSINCVSNWHGWRVMAHGLWGRF